MIKIIAAVSENNVIGLNNGIPWKLPADMKRFSDITRGNVVLMGRQTFYSLPERYRPLPGRKTVVLTRNPSSLGDYRMHKDIVLAGSLEEGFDVAKGLGTDTYVCGGSQIYAEAIRSPLVTGMEITRVHRDFEGDSYFPVINERVWNKVGSEMLEHDGLAFSYDTFQRVPRGLFITFEGIEGAGKSTSIDYLATRLEKLYGEKRIVTTREPGGTAIGEEIRHALKHAISSGGMTPETEFLLFSASRAQLVRELLLPSVEEGRLVLCDRFAHSSEAYQVGGRGLDSNMVAIITQFATQGLSPDLTMYLDVTPEEGFRRIHSRIGGKDRIESEHMDFFNRARNHFLGVSKIYPYFKVLDAHRSADEVNELVWNQVQELLTQKQFK